MAESWYDVGPRYSYPGVPAPAGVNDWREDGRLPPRADDQRNVALGLVRQLRGGVAGTDETDPSNPIRPIFIPRCGRPPAL